MRPIFEHEATFIASVIDGVNSPRSRFFFFDQPNLIDSTFISSTPPLLFSAAAFVLGGNYIEVMALTSFFNTLSTAAALYFASFVFSAYPFWIVVLYLLNGGWATFRLFSEPDPRIDLIHFASSKFANSHLKFTPSPHFQTTAVFLHFSLSSSYVLPMAILALATIHVMDPKRRAPRKKITLNRNFRIPAHYVLCGILISLCPSFLTSLLLLFMSTCFADAFIYITIFSAFILPRFLKCGLTYRPAWREYQMAGVFYSQIVSWLGSLGPPFFSIISVFLGHEDPMFTHHFTTCLAAFVFASFFREGNSQLNSDLAVSALFLPVLITAFVRVCARLNIRARPLKNKKNGICGIVNFAIVFVTISYMAGGCISISRLLDPRCRESGMTPPLSAVSRWVQQHVPRNETVMTLGVGMNPVAFAGRQLLTARGDDLWQFGYKAVPALALLSLLMREKRVVNYMRDEKIKWALEQRETPFVLLNDSIGKKFTFVEVNDRWGLMKLKEFE